MAILHWCEGETKANAGVSAQLTQDYPMNRRLKRILIVAVQPLAHATGQIESYGCYSALPVRNSKAPTAASSDFFVKLF
jgi:hypothetical protein